MGVEGAAVLAETFPSCPLLFKLHDDENIRGGIGIAAVAGSVSLTSSMASCLRLVEAC